MGGCAVNSPATPADLISRCCLIHQASRSVDIAETCISSGVVERLTVAKVSAKVRVGIALCLVLCLMVETYVGVVAERWAIHKVSARSITYVLRQRRYVEPKQMFLDGAFRARAIQGLRHLLLFVEVMAGSARLYVPCKCHRSVTSPLECVCKCQCRSR